jgi:hypothetical protein
MDVLMRFKQASRFNFHAMNIFMPDKERDLFLSYLHRPSTRFYYEFGSGGSTAAAIAAPNVQKIISMESDTGFYESTATALQSEKCTRILVEVGCRNNWGNPEKGHDGSLYFTHIDSLSEVPDLLLVDGRWRVACALHAWHKMNADSVLLFDDFVGRAFYYSVAPYFETIETVGRIVALRKRASVTPLPDLISFYEKDCR